MRWNVEVTSMDKSDSQSVVVEAESWQKALQAARASRGDSGPISGFSIELLDEGYRAVDPLARLRYDVKRAADDAALTVKGGAPAPVPAPVHVVQAAPPVAPAPPPAAPAPLASPVTPPAPPVAAAPAASRAPVPHPAPSVAPPQAVAAVVASPAPPPVAAAPAVVPSPSPSPSPSVTPAPPPVAATASPALAPSAVPPPVVAGQGHSAPPRPSGRPGPPSAHAPPAAHAPPSAQPTHAAPPTKKPPPPQSARSAPPPPVAPLPIESVSSSELEPLVEPVENGAADATIRTESLAESAEATRAIAMPMFPPPHVGLGAATAGYGPGPAYTPPPALAAPSADASGPIPPTQVIFKREHDPSDRLPLTYREYVFTVARGVDERAAERLLRVQLEQVRASIAHARPGKFVNLAVFDVVFQGRPPVPPLVTLAWKDWKGDAVVGFPRRPAPAPSPANGSAAPPIAPQRIVSVVPSPPQVEAPPPPPPPERPAPVFAPHVEAAPAPAFPAPSAPPPPAPASHAPAPLPFAIHALSPSAPPAPPPPAANNPFAASAVVADPFAPGAAALPVGVPVPQFPQPAPQALRADGSAPHAAQALHPAHPPHVPHRRADSSQRLLARGSVSRLTPTPSRPSLRPLDSGRRATGDELIANLFEAMHELQFTRDVVEGGDYVLALALEMIPSRAGVVHLYDINRREFVVACVSGPSTDVLLGRRHPETEPLFAAAMRKRRALLVSDPKAEGGAGDRFLPLGGITSLICSPVLHGGRFLGVIELADPTDGIPFTEHEANAIDYMSEQFAEFVASRGMDLDEDRISRRAPPLGP